MKQTNVPAGLGIALLPRGVCLDGALLWPSHPACVRNIVCLDGALLRPSRSVPGMSYVLMVPFYGHLSLCPECRVS